jgi:hypothetical protein
MFLEGLVSSLGALAPELSRLEITTGNYPQGASLTGMDMHRAGGSLTNL